MKKALSLLFIFVLSIASFAASRTGYYTSGQTRESVLENVKTFENAMFTYKYSKDSERKTNKYDYSQSWSYMSAGATSAATMRYQFFDDRVVVTMSDALFISKEGTRIPLQENDPTEVKRKVYESLENIMVNVFFKYLQVSENKSSVGSSVTPTRTTEPTNDQITAYYINITKDAAKKRSTEYIDQTLKQSFQTNYISSSTADEQEIKYTMDYKEGIITVIVVYQFSTKNYTIKLKTTNLYDKANKTNSVIYKEGTSEKLYNMIKTIFIDKHAAYITTGIKT